jgi:hypothetical protein
MAMGYDACRIVHHLHNFTTVYFTIGVGLKWLHQIADSHFSLF